MASSSRRSKAFSPDPDAPDAPCAFPECEEAAGFRAPKGRAREDGYFWFCLEHVRLYNANWNYCAGMTPAQIEAQIRMDVTWERPAWKMDRTGNRVPEFNDPLGIFSSGRQRSGAPLPHPVRKALKELELGWPTSMKEAKARYRHLAKIHHPDLNPNDPHATERLKNITQAYTRINLYLKNGTIGENA